MKQTQVNPWDQVAGKYPPGTMVEGTVRNLTNYGAFIEIEEGIDGLLHISDMSWTRKIGHPNEILEKGQRISCQVLNVDQERKRIALGLKQLRDDPWETDIPGRYEPNDVVKGKVTKLTNFGVFVELEPGLEGLLHISELADHKVDSPEEVVKVGDEIEVKILRVDRGERKIGLSRKKAHWTKPEGEREEGAPTERARSRASQGAQRRLGRRRPPFQHGRVSHPRRTVRGESGVITATTRPIVLRRRTLTEKPPPAHLVPVAAFSLHASPTIPLVRAPTSFSIKTLGQSRPFRTVIISHYPQYLRYS